MKQNISFYGLPGLNAALKKHQFSWKSVLFMTLAGAVTLFVTLVQPPVHAYDVVIQPAGPRQGDTVSIITTEKQGTADVPAVTINGSTFPTFALGNGRYRTFLPTSPLHTSGEYVIRVEGPEGLRNPMVWLSDRAFRTQYITLPPGRSNLGTDYEFDKVDAFKQIVSSDKLWSGSFLRPSQGRVSSEYGVRRYYNGVFAENYYHRGVDYAAAIGSPVIAPAAGRVVLVGRVSDGFELHGNTIGVDHGQGVESIFIHLNSINVQEGDFVQAGQVIGTVGSTGASTGPHLHWGLYVNGVAVDPAPWRNGTFE
ncbi:M23 family metallopeptidase [Oscillatoria sp. CS-180]|uniref:M23 family metallopeptidase n=1 Tax=Oscillatoria sp. CS-180 TaxID=3021720 RepID=UPI00232C68F6|nr:M23 family metallopeptidase [Oscillatoria sp. CS-180]MDB9524526.1 M23 family metallopeptidase [Oscillatoria sp. CS-180]